MLMKPVAAACDPGIVESDQVNQTMLDPAQHELILRCQGLVRSIAWQVGQKIGRRVDLEELVAYGQVGLAEAAQRYDPDRGHEFTTFAYHRIRGAILDGLKQMRWFDLGAYHASRYEHLSGDVLENESSAEAGEATLEQDAAWLTDTSARLAVVYLVSSLGEDAAAGRCAGQADRPESPLELREAASLLSELVDQLPRRTRDLLRAAYFEGRNLKEAGERLGVSKSTASRMHDKALRQLARGLRERGVDVPA